MENNRKTRKRGTKQEQPPTPSPSPLKVVYISNPMKLQTSASNFRSIVQELTGQHAVWPVDPSKYLNTTTPADSPAAAPSTSLHDVSTAPQQQQPPLDEDDSVVLIDHHMLHYMLHDHQDFAAQPRKDV